MREVLALGQVCRGLHSNLQTCGVITDICNYLCLPKDIKWSIHYFVTDNRLLKSRTPIIFSTRKYGCPFFVDSLMSTLRTAVVQLMRHKCLIQFIVINIQSFQIVKNLLPNHTYLAKGSVVP